MVIVRLNYPNNIAAGSHCKTINEYSYRDQLKITPLRESFLSKSKLKSNRYEERSHTKNSIVNTNLKSRLFNKILNIAGIKTFIHQNTYRCDQFN